jgi:hypothetical protein
MHLRDNNHVALGDADSMSRAVSFLSSLGVAVQIWDSYAYDNAGRFTELNHSGPTGSLRSTHA